MPLTTINLPDWYDIAAGTPKLDGIAAPLRYRVGLILQAMAASNIRMFVASGVRTDAEQVKLYAQGRTAPGSVVTQLDGVTKRSNHQLKTSGPYAGLGTAVDMAFIDVDGKASWAEHHPWTLYGRMATSLGLTWGGDWTSFKDKPHIELKG